MAATAGSSFVEGTEARMRSNGPSNPILLGVVLAMTLSPQMLPGQSAERLSYVDRLVPLLDRELFFGDPEHAGGELSPDGRWILFRKPYRGVMNLWVTETRAAFDTARPITADTTRPVRAAFWSQDSRFVVYLQDRGGNENFHVYVLDPAAEADASTGVPPARDLTPFERVRARVLAIPEPTPGTIVVGLNDRDPQVHDVYRIALRSGARELLFRNEQNVAGWQTDLEGRLRLGLRVGPEGGTEILRVQGDSLIPVYQCNHEETCAPIRYHTDGRRVYMVTNRGEDVDLTRLVLFDPATGIEEFVEEDPERQVDFAGAEFSDVTEELVATYYLGNRLRIYPKDREFAQDLELLRRRLPEGEIYFASSSDDGQLRIVRVTRDVDPGSVYLYDRATGRVELLYRARPGLPTEHLSPVRAIRYRARDGMEIPAYLTLPRGVESRNLALVIYAHGGPWARDVWGYDPFTQFLANRGYAVLQPNFRGSTGYGKAFLNAGNREWGTGAMQHDLTDGVRYLVERGTADPARVAIFGGSYGGYAALAGLAFTPDLYAAGISLVGPSNLVTLLRSIPPYWGPIRNIFHVRVGDPNDPNDRKRLESQSPLFLASRIRAPLLVAQGANDPRVNRRESEQIVVALRDLERDVEYLLVPDEGHGFQGPENRLAFATAMERFLAEHVGGRRQEELSPLLAERLARLTVDVAKVNITERAAAAEIAATAPLPTADGALIRPRAVQYRTTIEAMGQTIDIDVARTVVRARLDEREIWRVVDEVHSPLGVAVDTFDLDRASLAPLRRGAEGTGGVSLVFSDTAVTGELRVRGQVIPVRVALDVPVFGNESALTLVMAALPLAVGYETTLRVFDLETQRVRPMWLRVVGMEDTEAAAGTYETLVVELIPLDDDDAGTATLYVSREAPHDLVRSTTKLGAAVGGGSTTTELVAVTTAATATQ